MQPSLLEVVFRRQPEALQPLPGVVGLVLALVGPRQGRVAHGEATSRAGTATALANGGEIPELPEPRATTGCASPQPY
jgi:hypothetical protein